jgi:predicted ester cyclase
MNKLKLAWGLVRGLMQAPRTLGAAESFLAAWNRHDAAAIARQLGAGTYQDPLSQGVLDAAALATHVTALVTAFPDLRLELDDALAVGRDTVAARYKLKGTHTGPLPGGLGIDQVDATGRALDLPATLFIAFGSGGAMTVHNHFDLEALAEQLGFLALLMPRAQGDYQFGAYYRLNRGNVTPPEAIGMTWIEVHGGQAPFDEVAMLTNQVLESFSTRPGFVTGIIGARPPDATGRSGGFTLSAWENLEALETNLLPNEDHKKVVHKFMKERVAYATHSRVYTLVRAKPVMMACTACGKQNNAYRTPHNCSACGAELGPPPVHW